MHNEKASCLALHFAAYNLEHSFFLWKRMSRILCQWQNMCPIFSVLSFGRVFLYVFRWEMFGGGLCALDRGSNGQLPQGNCSMEEGGGKRKGSVTLPPFEGNFSVPLPTSLIRVRKADTSIRYMDEWPIFSSSGFEKRIGENCRQSIPSHVEILYF